MAMYNGELYSGGEFTTAGGVAASNIARWNGSSWDSAGSGVNNRVRALIVYNGELYAGGSFSSAGGNTAWYVAKWNGSSWSSVGTGMNGTVYTFMIYNGELYAGGGFTNAGGVACSYFAKWNGANWSSVGGTNGPAGYVYSLQYYNNELYAGGSFLAAGGTSTIKYIAKWNGSSWSDVGGGLSGGAQTAVWDFIEHNGELWVGGDFDYAGGVIAGSTAKWNGTSWSAIGTGMDWEVSKLHKYMGEPYAGGMFAYAGGTLANRIAKWNGTDWDALNGGGVSGGFVNSLFADSLGLYVGGSFNTAGGISASKIAKYTLMPSADFSSDTSACKGTAVTFTDQSTGSVTAWNWLFSGGMPSSSTLQNPAVTYNSSGNYDVTLMVSNINGSDTLVRSSYITINPSPTAGLSLPVTSVCFTDTPFTLTGGMPAGGVYSGTGVFSGIFFPSAAGIGTFTITYTYTDANSCSDSASQNISVTACSGIEDLENSGVRINLIDHPSGDIITMLVKGYTGGNKPTLCIYDLMGKKVMELPLTLVPEGGGTFSTRLFLGNLAESAYLYRLTDKQEGQLLAAGKILLQ